MSNNANKISDTPFLMSDKVARGIQREHYVIILIVRVSFVYLSCILRVYFVFICMKDSVKLMLFLTINHKKSPPLRMAIDVQSTISNALILPLRQGRCRCGRSSR